MSITKLLLGAIIGGIVFFLLGGLIYGHLLTDFMYHHTGRAGHIIYRKHVVLIYIIAANLLQGLLLSYILIKGNVNSLIGGLITGGIVGFLMAASIDCIMYATSTVLSKRGMVADIIAFTVISAIAGAIVAVVAGGGKKIT